MDDRYRLVYRGEVLEGQHRAVVKRRLMEALKLTEPQLEKLFSGPAVVLKKDADARTAARYQGLFKNAGARLRVLPVEAEDAPAQPAGPGSPDAVGAQPSGASTQPQADRTESGFSLLPADYQPPPSVMAPEIVAPDFVIADVGVDLLEHGPAPERVEIPEAPFEVAELGAYLLDHPAEPAAATEEVAEVDFELAEVGADIGVARERPAVAAPDISHLALTEP